MWLPVTILSVFTSASDLSPRSREFCASPEQNEVPRIAVQHRESAMINDVFGREVAFCLEQFRDDFATAKKLVKLARSSDSRFALASAYLAVDMGDEALGLLASAVSDAAKNERSSKFLDDAISAHSSCVENIQDALDALTKSAAPQRQRYISYTADRLTCNEISYER